MSDNTEALLRRAFSLGQTYLAQADSESYAQNRRSEETRQKFEALVAEASAALAQQAAPPAAQAGDALPPLPVHPEIPGRPWSPLEERTIRRYGERCARAALAARGEQAEPPGDEREAQEAAQRARSFAHYVDSLVAQLGDGDRLGRTHAVPLGDVATTLRACAVRLEARTIKGQPEGGAA